MKFLLVFSQSLLDFRLAELDSVVEVLNLDLSRPSDENVDLNSACLVVDIGSEDGARALAGRCVLIKWVICGYGGQSHNAQGILYRYSHRVVHMMISTRITKKPYIYGRCTPIRHSHST